MKNRICFAEGDDLSDLRVERGRAVGIRYDFLRRGKVFTLAVPRSAPYGSQELVEPIKPSITILPIPEKVVKDYWTLELLEPELTLCIPRFDIVGKSDEREWIPDTFRGNADGSGVFAHQVYSGEEAIKRGLDDMGNGFYLYSNWINDRRFLVERGGLGKMIQKARLDRLLPKQLRFRSDKLVKS